MEDQSTAATTRLTDSLADQELLEQLLDQTKPPMPPECEGYDFLLATPFRYAPYPDGSRFRRAMQPEGAFYGAEQVETAVAELAFYRLLFFYEAPAAKRPNMAAEHSAFSVRVSARALDLTAAPFLADRETWTHPTEYGPCQDLADAARDAGIEAVRYESVRDPNHGVSLAVLTVTALASKAPDKRQTWHIYIRDRGVQAWCEFPRRRLEFPMDAFSADPRMAAISR
ncbi:MAG: RES family NAD+ phosphorylase [Bacteroidales bacterium]